MIVMPWNELVNTELYLSGDYGHEGDYVNTVKFNSGKERIYLKNSFVPIVYPELGLILDNTRIIKTGENGTEFKQFKYWYETILRYGVLPFYFPRILYPEQTGIYQFIPDSLKFDGLSSIEVSFGWKEIG